VLTILYDNYKGPEELEAAWGFSCLVEGFARTVFFDTGGEGETLLHNMRHLQVTPEAIDAVVLSHNHWDHTGGLEAFLEKNSDVKVYLPEVFPDEVKCTVTEHGAEVIETSDATEICPHIGTTPVMGLDIPEQGLCVKTEEGTVVMTGCAHPGIADMVQSARKVYDGRIRAAFGGFHLKDAWITDINFTIARLKELGVRLVGPCHCSGDECRDRMRHAFGRKYVDLAVGSRIELGSETHSPYT
jgi:7,8-dihydropterin-6-yl-methyl-4-(beta-D-ribofuranosyl)aminobenzene 5'-phosphate synthase